MVIIVVMGLTFNHIFDQILTELNQIITATEINFIKNIDPIVVIYLIFIIISASVGNTGSEKNIEDYDYRCC